MKNRFALTLMATLICSTLAMAQLQKLPAPAKTGGKPVMEALWDRASGTEFSDKMLSDQDLSNLLFAAIGVNRPRMTMDVPAIKKLLKLSDSQVPLLNNPVGYAK